MKRHGLSIGMERVGNKFLLTLKAVGKLSHADYQTITPLIDAALYGVENPRIKAFIDISQLEGWELRAAWDDFKISLKHGSTFDKIALYGGTKWQERMSVVASWFVSGDLRYFDESVEALEWLAS